jgi:hypothetical protein
VVQLMSCRVTCGPMQPFTCKQKCMELGIDPTDALELPTPITCPYERKTVACIWLLQQQDIPPQLAALASDSCWPALTTNCKETPVIRVLACMGCMYVSCRSLRPTAVPGRHGYCARELARRHGCRACKSSKALAASHGPCAEAW